MKSSRKTVGRGGEGSTRSVARAITRLLWLGWATAGLAVAQTRLAVRPGGTPGAYPVATDYQSRVWLNEDGLPDNSILALTQTRDGFLWIGTRSGLARFDGVRFTLFNLGNTPALISDDCTALAPSPDGTLWIGTVRGLVRYRDQTFTRWPGKDGRELGAVRALAPYRNGGVWVATSSGLNRWRDGRWVQFGKADGLRDQIVNAMAVGEGGALWVITGIGLQRYNPRIGRFSSPLNGAGTHADILAAVLADGLNACWVLAEVGKRYELGHYQAGRWTIFPASSPGQATLARTTLVRDQQGDLWLPIGHQGLARFHAGRFARFSSVDGLSDSWVRCVFVDREGNLWIGTDGGGLNRWRVRRFNHLTREEGLAGNNVRAICETRDGAMWVGTDTGLSRVVGRDVRNYTEKDGLPGDAVRALCESPTGTLWIGTSSGLGCWRDGVMTASSIPGGPDANHIHALAVTADGTLWVGTSAGLWTQHSGQWLAVKEAQGLLKADVRALMVDHTGAVWVGTSENGLFRYHVGPPRQWTQIEDLSDGPVWALAEGTTGMIWIGTQNGLCGWRAGTLRRFTRRDGLLEPGVNAVLEDHTGHLWLGGQEGLYRLDGPNLEAVAQGRARRLTVATFGRDDGLLSTEINGQESQPAACEARDGRLWWATTRGVAVVNPRDVNGKGEGPPVVLEAVLADNEPIDIGPALAAQTADKPGEPFGEGDRARRPAARLLRLAPGSARLLEFRYTANSFAAPEKVRFKYFLEGWDRAWQEVGDRRVAYYTNLQPGRYRFEVLACDSLGHWSRHGATLAFYLEPFFYETWWFYGLAGLVVALITGGAFRFRLRLATRIQRLERENALAQERRRIAKDLHDEVGADLTQISQLIEVARREDQKVHTERARELLTKAQQAVTQVARTMSEIIWSTDPRRDSVEGLADYLCRYTEEFLDPTPVRGRFAIPPSLPPIPLSARARHEVMLSVKEALNNVVKHAQAREVWLRIAVTADKLCLSLEDNGQGFSSDDAGVVGNGLFNMRRRIESVGGRCQIESQPGGGTAVRIHLPLGEVPK